jgi:MFS family permease
MDENAFEALMRKIAWRLLPILFLGFLISFIDRVNIAFAKQQMGAALGLSDTAFGLGAGLFFIGYVTFEIPANYILERVGAKRWISLIMVVWGFATMAMALVQSPMSFYLLRVLLGVAEAGFFPGVIYFISIWFPESHRGRMLAIFMSALALSGIAGGPICGAILQYFDGTAGIQGWQWLMILTGLPAILVAFAIYLIIADNPSRAPWLTDQERSMLAEHHVGTPRAHGSIMAGVKELWSWKIAFVYGCLGTGGYAISFWIPTILREAGIETDLEIGFLVAIPNVIGGAAMIMVNRWADQSPRGVWALPVCCAVAAAGLAITAASAGNATSLLIGLSIAFAGVLSGLPLCWAIAGRYMPAIALSAGIALANSLGNLSGFFGPVLVGKISDMTGTILVSFWVLSGLSLIAMAASSLFLQRATRTEQ